MSQAGKLVLVTGASGFIATHIVKQLQEAGYRVRGTVRDLQNDVKCKAIRDLCPDATYPVELVEADLTREEGWAEAVKDCEYVIHTASPVPSTPPNDENEVIKPAVEGTLRVLKAIRESKTVKRCVLTSSIAAIYGVKELERYNEEHWTNPETPGLSIYCKSKTLAERAAWDFIKDEQDFELVVLNPVAVFGPALCGGDEFLLGKLVRKMLNREIPMLPQCYEGVIDVRDVAKAHVAALTLAEAAGKRFILSAQTIWFKDIATFLSDEFKSQGYNVSTSVAPNWLMWFVSFFHKEVAQLYPMLGRKFDMDTSNMRNILGIQPIDFRDSVIDMAYSMIERGMVEKTDKYRGREKHTS